MPRVGRKAPGGLIYHVLNRGNGRQRLFHTPADYQAFVDLLREVAAAVPGMRLLAYCLMPNHWHLILWPKNDGELSSFMLRLTTAHVRRSFAHHHNEAGGHLYQGRFKSFPVQDDHHFLLLCRYVEANPLRAGLVKDAGRWAWCSFALRKDRPTDADELLTDWPIARPRNWASTVADALAETQLESIRTSLQRGRPLGSPTWTESASRRLGLEFTLRPRGRPPKAKAAAMPPRK